MSTNNNSLHVGMDIEPEVVRVDFGSQRLLETFNHLLQLVLVLSFFKLSTDTKWYTTNCSLSQLTPVLAPPEPIFYFSLNNLTPVQFHAGPAFLLSTCWHQFAESIFCFVFLNLLTPVLTYAESIFCCCCFFLSLLTPVLTYAESIFFSLNLLTQVWAHPVINPFLCVCFVLLFFLPLSLSLLICWQKF